MEPKGFKSAGAQRTSWRIQRTAWVVLWIVLLLALLGGLGSGPLSRTTARSADRLLEVRYHRVWRVNNTEVLELRLPPDSANPWLVLDDRLLAAASLERITPAPAQTLVVPAGQRLVFAARGSDPAPVRLELVPRRMGRLRARLSAGRATSLDLTLWVLP